MGRHGGLSGCNLQVLYIRIRFRINNQSLAQIQFRLKQQTIITRNRIFHNGLHKRPVSNVRIRATEISTEKMDLSAGIPVISNILERRQSNKTETKKENITCDVEVFPPESNLFRPECPELDRI